MKPQTMYRLSINLLIAVLMVSCQAPDQTQRLDYPETRKDSVVESYHGIMVEDPYRWLEDDNSDETKAWVIAQNELTLPYLKALPGRDVIKNRLTELWDYPRYGTPTKMGGRYFYTYNNGLQNQSVLYVQDNLEEDPRVLLDPNSLSDDGTVALANWNVSKDGSFLQYGISRQGSDWMEFKIRDIVTGQDLDETLHNIKFSSAAWSPDNRGFYYQRYPAPDAGQALTGQNRNPQLMYHIVGTDQSADQIVYERPDNPDWGFSPSVSHDGRYLVINVWEGTSQNNRIYYKDLTRSNSTIQPFLDAADASYTILGNDGSVFYVLTNKDTPRYKVVSIDMNSPQYSEWRTIIDETEETLGSVRMLNNQFVAFYLKDAYSQVRIFSIDGTPRSEIAIPGIGTVSGFTGSRDDTESFYSYTSFNSPSSIYRYDFETETSTLYREPEVAFNPSDFVVEQHFYRSKDGTQVPMFIAYKNGVVKDGKNPTYLYGYGGFNVSLTPMFSVTNLAWMDMGGVLAIPNLRGGGEYGEQWHAAGTKERKQNVFDDFASAAEYLIDQGYTSPLNLAIGGGSNGGLLVAATMLQRPELFAAAIPEVGVLDMLRFHKFTIGWAWVSDYGSSDNAEDFDYLYAYSPLHNIREGVNYPATLILTADHDDRVVPAHSFKFAAELQSKYSGAEPMLIRIQTNAGHGAGVPTSIQIEESVDILSFMANQTEMDISKLSTSTTNGN